jgi:hypothetical protein
MDKQEANTLLTTKLRKYRRLAYEELVAKIGDVDCLEVTGSSNVEYQIEVQFLWDGEADGNVRVMGSIDDGGLRAFMPLCDGFIIAPDGPEGGGVSVEYLSSERSRSKKRLAASCGKALFGKLLDQHPDPVL